MDRMNRAEIEELMSLRGWSKTKLAAELGLSEHVVYRWLKDERKAGGPASILMRMWLNESRAAKKRPRVAAS
jgi:transposase